jgi:hypothetical protein
VVVEEGEEGREEVVLVVVKEEGEEGREGGMFGFISSAARRIRL